MENSAKSDGTFFYFAFGSNLLTKRIQIKNPSAKRYTSGVLENYRLDFHGHSKQWNGAVATIVEDESESVWGAVWKIDSTQMENLDRQEGVPFGKYIPIYIPVVTPDNGVIECRTYQLVEKPSKKHFLKPSKTYQSIILAGAKESGFPDDYIQRLKLLENNGQLAKATLLKNLESVVN